MKTNVITPFFKFELGTMEFYTSGAMFNEDRTILYSWTFQPDGTFDQMMQEWPPNEEVS